MSRWREQKIPLRQDGTYFVQSIRDLRDSEVGGTAKRRFLLLIALTFGIIGLNFINSYVGRDFMTAIANRDMAGFIWMAGAYIVVFGASTAVAVFLRFNEERLGLLWRKWLAQRLVGVYLGRRFYYRLDETGQIANPDQRIADDVRSFTTTTLSFTLMVLNASLTVIAFSWVLWSISPLLWGVSIVYAALGTLLTFAVGHPLYRLDYNQFDKEANFRSGLIHVRENAEAVALLHREGRLKARLLRQLDDLAANLTKIIAVNRNLNFCTTGYNYLIQIIPALIVAPLFIRGEVEFGVIPQSAMAFAHLIGAFSLIVTQFQAIFSFTAVITRLRELEEEAGEQAAQASVPTDISTVEEDSTLEEDSTVNKKNSRIVYEGLTLRSPQDERVLVENLSITIPWGKRLLIQGQSGTAKTALLRATAGLWHYGKGCIIRPGLDRILFLPERPYVSPGTLRELLLRTGQEQVIADELILVTLYALDLRRVLERAGGLDAERDWDTWLSLAEQQLLAVARLILAKPQFAFLNRPGSALSPEQMDRVVWVLCEHKITYLTLGTDDDKLEHYDALLELARDGSWTERALQESRGGGWMAG